MTYTEAVSLARAGDERGFEFLYQSTYKSKYYLALQYMKNEEEAQDVLQEAYIKAFAKLDTLDDPEAFPGWLGSIVANTAKNMLAKKNPMLFSEITAEEEKESFEYQIEDENIENQPEVSYTRQETQALVRELIDALSEEQRMCILMFHIEGASIREIAEALNCSENTVKSRLNYGRKNLKIKAEELKKKGYNLYSIAPLPLLLYLLRTEEANFVTDESFAAVGKFMEDQVVPHGTAQVDTGLFGEAQSSMTDGQQAAANGAQTAAKAGFLHTAAGKAAVVILGVCVAGGAVFYGTTQLNKEEPEPEVTQEKTAREPEPEETETVKEVTDDQYSSLIAGNLTKEELELVLSYGPDEIPEGGIPEIEYPYILGAMLQTSLENGGPVENHGGDASSGYRYSLEDANRLFSSFTDYQFTEETASVQGEWIIHWPVTINFSASAEITSAEYTEEEMDVYFTYVYTSYSPDAENAGVQTTTEKKAVLEPNEEGMYRIVSIEPVSANEGAENTPADTEPAKQDPAQSGRTMQEVYADVLKAVENQEPGYEFPNAGAQASAYQYFTYDMDGDGIEELIVGAEFSDGMVGQFVVYDCRVFGCSETEGGYELKQIDGNVVIETLYTASDGNGLYCQEFMRGTGQVSTYRLTLQNGALTRANDPEYEFTFGDAAMQEFSGSNPAVQWTDISDLSGLS